MNLKKKSEFAKLAGVGKGAISNALKRKRLEEYMQTGQIDLDSALSQAYLKSVPAQRSRQTKVLTVTNPVNDGTEFKDSAVSANNALEKKLIEESELKRQQRIKMELQNAVRRGELVEQEAVKKSLLPLYDKSIHQVQRTGSALYDMIVERTLANGAKVPGLKQEFQNELMKALDEGKVKTVKMLKKIQIDQSRG